MTISHSNPLCEVITNNSGTCDQRCGCSCHFGLRLSLEELRVLYKLIEHEYIPYENEEAHAILNKIMKTLRHYELAIGPSIPTPGT